MNPGSTEPQTNYFPIAAAFALSIFFVRFDGFIVNLAMETFVKTFNINIGAAAWVALSYILAQACAIMLFGKVCDRFNLKKVFRMVINRNQQNRFEIFDGI